MRLKMYIAVFAFLALSAIAANAQTTVFTYQGRLTESGLPPTGTYEMQFSIYDAVGGGTQIGTTVANNAVTVTNGVFSVQLNFNATPFAAGTNRWLEIAVRKPADPPGYTTLTPRQQLTSSPYSIRTLSAALADNVTGVVAVTNGGTGATASTAARTNLGAAASGANSDITSLNGTFTAPLSISRGGTGSTTKNFVDLTTAQTAAGNKTFTNNIRNNGLFRSGNETGTFDPPDINDGSGYLGLVIRRINSFSSTLGAIIARTESITFERDGTNGGIRVSYLAEDTRSLHCVGVNNFGSLVAKRIVIPATAGTTQVYTNAELVEFLQCSFSSTFGNGHTTQITMQRTQSDQVWIGTVISTYNQ